MFVTEETTIGLPLGWAVARLGSTIESGWFGEVSDHAYAAGLAVLARADPEEPPGDVRGPAQTVQVRLSGPRERKTSAAYALRWEGTEPAGGLFPVLDADLSLIQVDASSTRLAIIACYRPSPGTLDVRLDRRLLNRIAQTTLSSLLDGVAREITQPARTPALGPARSAAQAGEALCEGRATTRSALRILHTYPNGPWLPDRDRWRAQQEAAPGCWGRTALSCPASAGLACQRVGQEVALAPIYRKVIGR